MGELQQPADQRMLQDKGEQKLTMAAKHRGHTHTHDYAQLTIASVHGQQCKVQIRQEGKNGQITTCNTKATKGKTEVNKLHTTSSSQLQP